MEFMKKNAAGLIIGIVLGVGATTFMFVRKMNKAKLRMIADGISPEKIESYCKG